MPLKKNNQPVRYYFFISANFFKAIFLILFACFFKCPGAQAQVLETNPPSLKWRQVNTPGFRVIFPEGFDEQGIRVANTLEHIRLSEAKSLGTVPRKISIILQNQSAVSNGFVSMFPRRSEFYAMPSQDYNFLGNNDWLDLLASHEYRHIAQFQHANRGFNRLFYYLFGATAMTGMAQMAAPQWFWEGDAVAAETAFTPSGRGKIPNFSLVFKTNLLEGRTFNYHKQYLRSYKHNIPDHYVLGYHMVSYLRKRSDDGGIWGKISKRSWSVPFIPLAFSNAIHRESGLYVTGLYRAMADDLKKQWQKQIDSLVLTPYASLEVDRKGYTDFQYPQILKDSIVIAMRSGIGDIVQFVDLTNDEKVVFTPGFINDAGMLSASGATIVWTEFGYHPRWLVKNYSLIKAYDVNEKRMRVIGGKQSRYTSAAISPDEKKIVAVSTDTEYKTSVVVLSYPEGKVLHKFQNPGNAFYSMPRWSNDNEQIAILKTTKTGKALVILDSKTLSERLVTSYRDENFGHPVLYNDYLLFNSPVTGIDNIFAIDLKTSKRFQITSSKYGAYNPVVASVGKILFYNDQTRDGLDVVKINFDPASWRPFSEMSQPSNLYQHLIEQEQGEHTFGNVPQNEYPVKRFRRVSGLVNPYNWGFYVNNDLTEGNFGISSQNLLSTLQIDAGYVFDINERTSLWRAGISYQGFFPIIDLSASIGNRSVNETVNGEVLNFSWKEQNLVAGIRVPLLTSSSKFASGLTLGNRFALTKVTDFDNSIDEGGRIFNDAFLRTYQDDGTLFTNILNLSAYRLMKRSRRDINSKWGQRIDIEHRITPEFSDFQAEQFASTAILYFPGLFKHHSLWGYGAFQHTFVSLSSDNYIYQNDIPVPRGLTVSRFQNVVSTSVNYTLPIWYPDIAVGPVVNFQRLRANVFLDFSHGENTINNLQMNYSSYGIEAKLDMNLFRFLPQFDLGVRYSRGISRRFDNVELLIGTINL